MAKSISHSTTAKPRRGRPKGSKNRPKDLPPQKNRRKEYAERRGQSVPPVIYLDRETEDLLWRQYIAGGRQDSALLARILASYTKSVWNLAYKIRQKLVTTLETDELAQEGYMGMHSAAQSFEISKGFRFWTFAERRCRGAMLDYVRKLDPVPRLSRLRERSRKQAHDELTQSLGRYPTDSEVEAAIDDERISGTARPKQTISIESVIHEGENRSRTIRDELKVVCGSLSDAGRRRTDEFFREMTRCLSMHQQTLVYLYMVQDVTMKVIGQAMNLSESRISQQMTEALSIMRKTLDHNITSELYRA